MTTRRMPNDCGLGSNPLFPSLALKALCKHQSHTMDWLVPDTHTNKQYPMKAFNHSASRSVSSSLLFQSGSVSPAINFFNSSRYAVAIAFFGATLKSG